MAGRKKLVTKLTGDTDIFEEGKLRESLRRSGAAQGVIEPVIAKVKEELYDGITSKEIYNTAFSLLRRKARPVASRYKLKRALMELGPTGFPFEIYMSELFRFRKFHTKVGTIMKGHCVTHEVDILARKDNLHYMIECKFHNDLGSLCNVKVPLYVYSRFRDIETNWRKEEGHESKLYRCGLVTNTRFTSDALQYGNCMGIYMLSWNYPANDSLKVQIDKSALYPITSMLSLTSYEKRSLLDMGIVLCKNLHRHHAELKKINITPARILNIMKEAEEVCSFNR